MNLKDKHVFIVEDNTQNRVIFELTLTRYGCAVTFERVGTDTISRLSRAMRPDLIVLDLMLAEGISGFDTFDEIRRKLPDLASVPIVAVSAMDPSVAVPKAREKGFAGFIAKPIRKDLFPKQVEQLIANEQVWYTGLGASLPR
jgi:CheY-like chemotaxis protein